MMPKKLTPYEMAETWSQVNLAATRIISNEQKTRSSAQLFLESANLVDYLDKILAHETALILEKDHANQQNGQ